jgi:hypothetical protein
MACATFRYPVGRLEDPARAALASRLRGGRARLAATPYRSGAHRIRARADSRSNAAVILETGTPRNVPLYESLGFVVEEADPPEGGPHVWFMRRDP